MSPFPPSSKFTLEKDMKAQRGEYRYMSSFSSTSVLEGDEWSKP